MSDNRRGTTSRRTEILRHATLITSDGHHIEVRLKDLSVDGFRFEHPGADLLVGEIVQLDDGRSTIRAQLKWVNDKDAGGEFLEAPGRL